MSLFVKQGVFLGCVKKGQKLSVYPLLQGPLHHWLWLTGRVSVLLLEGRWFDSPGQHVKVFLGKVLNPKLLVGTLHGSHCHQCMYELL